MKKKNVLVISLIIMAIAIICMGINIFIRPLPDMIVRITGAVMLINLIVLSYSTSKLIRKEV